MSFWTWCCWKRQLFCGKRTQWISFGQPTQEMSQRPLSPKLVEHRSVFFGSPFQNSLAHTLESANMPETHAVACKALGSPLLSMEFHPPPLLEDPVQDCLGLCKSRLETPLELFGAWVFLECFLEWVPCSGCFKRKPKGQLRL